MNLEPGFISLIFEPTPPVEMLERAKQFNVQMNGRRTTRHFSSQDVPRELIELAIKTASTAPSGAHLQPWTFVAISNSKLKEQIRDAAEQEEHRTYEERMRRPGLNLFNP